MCSDQNVNLSSADDIEKPSTETLHDKIETMSGYLTVEVVATLNIYYMPILIVSGSLGNLLSVYVFYTSKLRLQSTSVYLSALAISDTLFLLQLLPPWLDAVGFSRIFYVPGFCQSTIYISYVACCVSTWIVVAFTVERFVAVLYPLQRSLICTVYRAKYIVLALTCVALILNAPVLKFVSPSANCSIDEEYLVHAARFNIVDTALVFTVPLAIIIILNSRIMMGVYRLERARLQLLKVEQRPGPRLRTLHPPRCRSQQGSHHRVTRMLLLVSSVFVFLNLPAYTMRILAYTYDVKADQHDGRWAAYQQLATTFFNTNFGINFMLYCLSGQNFRRAFCHSVPCLRRRAIRADAARTLGLAARASSNSTSFASAGVDAMNTVTMVTAPTETQTPVRRHRSEPIIKRWTFDNSRQRQHHDTIEMTTYTVGGSGAGTEHTI